MVKDKTTHGKAAAEIRLLPFVSIGDKKMKICTKMTGMEVLTNSCILHTDGADIQLYFLTEDILRMRVSFQREFPEESYVLMLTSWEDRMDPLFAGRRERVAGIVPALSETETGYQFMTEKVKLLVDKDPLSFRLYDREGDLLYQDIAGNPFLQDSNFRIQHFSAMDEEDCFYGFGEKGGELNKNKRFLRERATDAMGYDAEKTDTLYKHIPFYIQLHRESGKAIGVFYHNFYESVFNMGCEKSNYWGRYSYWQADGGDIDCFLIAEGTIPGIVNGYTRLTGRPALLPKRALGYQASSMYYSELEKDCDREILDFVDTIKEEGFPIDGFHLSSGYTSYRGKRCLFTWNRDRFPDPKAYFAAMNEKGAQNVPNVKPGILLMHPYFSAMEERGVFVRDSQNPDTYAVGRWWGGDGAFFDYTSPKGRAGWKQYLTENLISVGTNSVWDDNCEYDSLLDKDSICDFEGKQGSIAALKALQSNLMCKATVEAIEEHDSNARPYVVCRSGSAGIQQYAQTWCGDNHTDWESLKYGIPIITGMGLSGQPNEGADIGGFAGEAPEGELFVRWVQQGIFQARFSIHSASSDNTVTEPWMYRDKTELIRSAILFRYRMTPYLYSLLYEATQTGAPIMRALVYEFEKDPKVWDSSFDYMFGRDILVANVLEKGAKTRKVYLPQGTRWYDWADHFRCYEGGQEIEIPVDISSIPMFLREGAVVPMADNQIYSMEREHVTDLHLLLVPGVDRSFTLYDDDGKSNDYRHGGYRKTEIRMEGKELVKLSLHGEGSYPDSIERILVEMVKKEKSPYFIKLGDRMLSHYLNRKKFEKAMEGWYYSQSDRAVSIKFDHSGEDVVLSVSFEKFDLIGM